MNFDVGEVLSRAGQITWKHRVLWIIGILFGFFVSTMFLLMIFFPFLLPVSIQNSRAVGMNLCLTHSSTSQPDLLEAAPS